MDKLELVRGPRSSVFNLLVLTSALDVNAVQQIGFFGSLLPIAGGIFSLNVPSNLVFDHHGRGTPLKYTNTP